MSYSYKQAGVDLEAGYEAVSRIKKHVARTERKGIMGTVGGFGGMFDLSSLNLKEPVLVSGTDGVGTKLKLAFQMDKHDTIGIDAVAMCVNDVVVQGAEPLYFLDYIACGKAVPEKIEAIVKGIADGCEQSNCALIGGETAEMPGLYEEDEYDLAGFTVGAVEKSEIITGENVKPGQLLVGISSSGIHSNGYSLVRKIVDDQKLDLQKVYEGFDQALGLELLTPTKIYVKPVLQALEAAKVAGMAHITGGGFIENIPRMLPDGLGVEIDYGSWPIPKIFDFLQEYGGLERKEMFEVFNMGIGFVLAVEPEEMNAVINAIESKGEKAFVIGRVTEGNGVEFSGGVLG
ncbi:phosphoribosylformylglycinamidine cyclo-ligase [Priestia flexa]|jgi:phosphoribosylformylglycinamidine cyclo-ligase|uniref:phosphoribosylformylglycinamidine cyclo-ligase n=1 Tax=Bacillaceae TaxID=186817 RepID=UPI0004735544|nr:MULTISPECIES: phosphoribosylformylglycinamidine cyclo-ligase [Bacillaceae]AQX56281.1 phosphoribosylformylglycinamidine cyclo-ligase [Priestia flexa]KZB90488.1 phosphoribosylformylglycinamidine cyclo-ligase [Bacillus sp. VT 712]MBN8435944.1 phosphoribosylformylglycinamidine cyclo-ligase [Priestia flexa]MCA0968501.1 phosphoribosylformylglycinamidine cyclo-ligase [Priestia flexa]MCA1203916.1 phosphoribosylformylglycinamidine cyclo-ligase [Priestia flexa]